MRLTPARVTVYLTRTIEIEVECLVTPATPARLSGPPDLCHPAEGGEVEIDSATLDGQEIGLTPTEKAEVYELAREAAADADQSARDDEAERRAGVRAEDLAIRATWLGGMP